MTPFLYRCSQCGRTYRREEVRYLCPACGRDYRPGVPLPGVLEAAFDVEFIRRSLDRGNPDWGAFCAVEREYHPPFPVGNTPFLPSVRLGSELGLEALWIKLDGSNPSGSLKDRASFLVVAEAARLGERRIVTASTGNAASSLAAVCASAGREAVIFVPEKVPRAKLAQMLLHGARVVPVKGTYDAAFRLSMEYTLARGGLNRNTAYHPLTLEGKKTAGLEIFAQNGLKAPDAILVPVGDGVILAGVHKAFKDLQEAGLTERLPRLVAVQAEGSDAIHRYVQTGAYVNAGNPATVADSISVGCPSNAHLARRAILESDGFSLTVKDDEILEAEAHLARTSGLFAEPAAAAALAGLRKIQAGERCFGAHEQVVLLLTGHGLKDVETALSRTRMPAAVEPSLEALPW